MHGKLIRSKANSSSVIFWMYVFVIGIYAGVQLLFSLLMRIPACHSLTNSCDRWAVVRFFKWMYQERYYLGREMYERTIDYIKYMLFWVVVIRCKFAFAYFLQIEPLVKPTRIIANLPVLEYSWHDFVSKMSTDNHNALAIASLWAPVIAEPVHDRITRNVPRHCHPYYAGTRICAIFYLWRSNEITFTISRNTLLEVSKECKTVFPITIELRCHSRRSVSRYKRKTFPQMQ